LVATIDQGDGVEGMTLSPDGETLYVALAATDEVAEIDIASIKTDPTAPAQTLYPLTQGDVPYSVAVQSGEVWVSYNVGTNAAQAAIGDISLSAASPSSAFTPGTR
jgi:streptogramin lyase